jgi:hypothetical protein
MSSGRLLNFSDALLFLNIYVFLAGYAQQDWLNVLVNVSWLPIGLRD